LCYGWRSAPHHREDLARQTIEVSTAPQALAKPAQCALLAHRSWRITLRSSANMSCSEKASMPNTVRLHRVLATKPEKVYRAFIEADAMAKWLPPNGFACTVHHLEAKVGGSFRMSFRNFTTGKSHSFGGQYLELVPGERLRYTDKFDDPNLPGEIQVTVALKPVSCGTELNIVQEGLPDAIPVEACYLGWQDSLRNLASLVEPEINQ
jgi:uncharacterized protein YndB with AHSA1/START domain